MAFLITNIKQLIGVRDENNLLRGADLADLPFIENAYLVLNGERIADFGRMEDLKDDPEYYNDTYDAGGGNILPAWCDSHTHLVFAASRENEFVQKLKGATYADIAAWGGGILNSAEKIKTIPEDELFELSYERLKSLMRLGTGAIEIKSGYGLTLEGELKMLRVIKRLKETVPIPVKSTFLGAHAVPLHYKGNQQAYVDEVINKMMPVVAEEGLADYVDAFCEEGFFTPGQTEQICNAGSKYGLKPKIHANQLHVSGGVQAGIRSNAISVDHLESMDDEAINALAHSSTIGTLLPTAAFFLRMQYQEARKMIDAGCAIALASDYNPGSSPSGNMNFVVALSCIQLKMLPEEAINAATINGAYAMEVENEVGSITIGKKANFILTKPVPSYTYLPYAFGDNHIERVMLAGEWVY